MKLTRKSAWFRLVACLLSCSTCNAWKWSDFVDTASLGPIQVDKTLAVDEIKELRVRDLKRRLARSHGYSADELARILDKKDLISALTFEEEKKDRSQEDKAKRILFFRSIITTIIAVVAVLCWPFMQV